VKTDRLLRPRLSDLWAFLAIALPVLAALVATMPAVDLAYQLRAGGSFLDGAGIPHTDTYTFTIAGTVWPDQQWGAQALLAVAYRLGSWNALAILRAVLVGATFGLLLVVVRRRAPQLPMRGAALLVLGAFLVAAPALALRPQLFAMVLFAASLLVLADRDRHPGRVWLLPVFALLWANLHGSFPLAIVLPGLAWLADLREESTQAPGAPTGRAVSDSAPTRQWLGRHTMLAVAAMSALATLVNPLGLGVWSYVVSLATNPTIGSRVSEWRPPGLTDAPGILFWLSVVLVAAFIAWRARRNRAAGGSALPPWPALLTLVVFALLGAVTGRGLAWWPLVAVFVCAGFLGSRDAATGITDGEELRGRARRRDQGSRLNALVAGMLILVGIALLPMWRPVGPAGLPIGVVSYAPQGITQRLELFNNLNSHAATVWNPQVWGSWLEFAVPGELVAVDSRIELFPTALWDDVGRVSSASPDAIPILERYHPDFVVVERPAQTALEDALAATPAWACIYQDVEGSIWARSDTVLAGGALAC
jgi:glycerol-3-phosphate acyltransferase PlsY